MLTPKDHTFVICAYKESPHLEEAIRSIRKQTVLGNVFIATSTPNDYLKGLATKYQIPLKINDRHGTLGEEWNYGYNQAKTHLVTIAHQDDIYEPYFLELTLKAFNNAGEQGNSPRRAIKQQASEANGLKPGLTKTHAPALISFTDYYEIRGGERVNTNSLLRIKRTLLFFMRFKILQKSQAFKELTLRFGNPICCPSITYNKGVLGESIFDSAFVNSLDYLELVKLAKRKGSFLYIDRILMGHRIHKESATTHNIANNSRRKEDMQIFEMLWPRWMARVIGHFYAKSEESNKSA